MAALGSDVDVFGAPGNGGCGAPSPPKASPREVDIAATDQEELSPLVADTERANVPPQPAPGAMIEADEIDWQGRRLIYIGRIRLLRIRGRTLFIGPHWYATLAMLCVINAVGSMFIWGIAMSLGAVHLAGGLLATVGSTLACIQCAVGDPGILRPHPSSNGGPCKHIQYLPSNGKKKCEPCGIIQTGGSLHCEYCEVCIVGWDHHCPWMSKCIGARNLQAFYRFLCTAMGSLAYIVTCTILSS